MNQPMEKSLLLKQQTQSPQKKSGQVQTGPRAQARPQLLPPLCSTHSTCWWLQHLLLRVEAICVSPFGELSVQVPCLLTNGLLGELGELLPMDGWMCFSCVITPATVASLASGSSRAWKESSHECWALANVMYFPPGSRTNNVGRPATSALLHNFSENSLGFLLSACTPGSHRKREPLLESAGGEAQVLSLASQSPY